MHWPPGNPKSGLATGHEAVYRRVDHGEPVNPPEPTLRKTGTLMGGPLMPNPYDTKRAGMRPPLTKGGLGGPSYAESKRDLWSIESRTALGSAGFEGRDRALPRRAVDDRPIAHGQALAKAEPVSFSPPCRADPGQELFWAATTSARHQAA